MKNAIRYISFFWIFLILMDNPAGFFSMLGITDSTLIKLFRYFLFFIAVFYWMLVRNRPEAKYIRNQPLYKSMGVILTVWAFFYFFVYAGYNANDSLGIFTALARHHLMIIGILVFFITAQVVAIGANDLFLKNFSVILIAVGVLSLITAFTGLKLVQVGEYQRHFTSVKRIVFQGGKIIYFILPLAAAHLALNYKKDYRIYTAFVLIVSMIVIAILRRWMIGTISYALIVFVALNYIRSRPLLLIPKKTFGAAVGLIFAFVLFLGIVKRDYLGVIIDTAENLIAMAQGDIDVNTADDDRISFTKQTSMLKAFTDNMVLGTGYDEKWFNNTSKDDHWEGADYIFLGVLGQFGIMGILIFIFYYISIVRAIIKGMRLIKRNWLWLKMNMSDTYQFLILFLASSAEFIRNLLEYPNWFVPISASSFGYLFFIYGGILVGSYLSLKNIIAQRDRFYLSLQKN